MKNILIVAAENSAENYGSKIIDQFNLSDRKVSFFGAGGDKLRGKGVELIVHSRELSIVGIVEVISSILRLKKIMNNILDSCRKKRAAGAILIDYPDFNLRLAKKLKKAGIPVYYYISPTVWAWRYSRIKIIRKYVDHMFVIFPFEQDIYDKEKIPYTYTGHPLIPSIRINKERDVFRKGLNIRDEEKILLLLPGSRLSEIESLLPEMLSTVKKLRSQNKFKAIILKADNINDEIFKKIIDSSEVEVDIINQDNRYDLFNASDVALASCGTSNLELAVSGLPFVAVYKVNKLSYLLGKGFLKISLYSIVNILLKKQVVNEFIQKEFTAKNCAKAVSTLLNDQDKADEQRREFLGLKAMLSLKSQPSEIISGKLISLIFGNK